MGVHLEKKKLEDFPMFFVIHSSSPCLFSPSARESIFVAILLNLLRKGGTMMHEANVSHGKTQMVRNERVNLRSLMKLYRDPVRFWCCANVGGREKNDEKAKEKQIKGIDEQRSFYSPRRRFNV
jgi:hypothetical protein